MNCITDDLFFAENQYGQILMFILQDDIPLLDWTSDNVLSPFQNCAHCKHHNDHGDVSAKSE